MNDDVLTMSQFGEEVPKNYARRHNDIKGMFGAKLRDLDASIYNFHYFITYAIYLVAEYECIFFIFSRPKLIKHDAFFSLLNSYYFITLLAKLFDRH